MLLPINFHDHCKRRGVASMEPHTTRLKFSVPALLLPFISCWVQWQFWSVFKPFVWLLFFPAIFFSSRIGGKYVGLASTVISALLALYFFIPPQLSITGKNTNNLYSVGVFLLMGVLFSYTHDRLERARQRTAEAQEAARAANEQLQEARISRLQVEQKRTEGHLRRSEERLRLALDATSDGLWDWDVTTGVVYRSPRYYELVGRSPDESTPDFGYFTSTVHPDDLPHVLETIEAHKQGTTEAIDFDYRLSGNAGETKWLHVRGRAVERDAEGAPLRIVGTLSDITKRKQAEEELRHKNAEIEQFLYIVSHDLRSPLVTVKSFLGYLENDIAGSNGERISQDLHYIHSAADKMEVLLNELLKISRIGRVETTAVRVSLLDLLNGVLDVVAGVVNERKAEIRLPGMDLILFADHSHLVHIWQNLIENAVKYSRDSGIPRIELGVQQSGGETVFFVGDNGIGIDRQFHTKVFGIFEKLDQKSRGAGLGLSMVQRIVEKYGGRIWVESEGLDKGSCFYFTLPSAMVKSGTQPDG